jgi:hypothetical protein
MHALFPILTLIFTVFLFIRYGIWEKIFGKNNVAKEPRKTTPASKPGMPKEGFDIKLTTFYNQDIAETQTILNSRVNNQTAYVSSYSAGSTSTTTIKRAYPLWSGPSIKFAETANDAYYLEYRDTHLLPTPEMIARLNALPIENKVIPNFGEQLSNFDAEIQVIPWDADNLSYTQDDIVWGYVSSEASKSIFMKIYHRKLLEDADNFKANDNNDNNYNLMYKSAVLLVSTNDPVEGALYQLVDSQVVITTKYALGNLQQVVYDKLFPGNSTRSIDMANNALRAEKIAKNIDLTPDEIRSQKLFDRKYSLVTLTNKLTKFLEKYSIVTKFKAGINQMKRAATFLLGKVMEISRKFITKFVPKFISKVAIAITATATAQITAGIAAAASFGILLPFATIVNVMASIIQWIAFISMIMCLALSVILPTIFAKAFANGSNCPQGKPLDLIIDNETAYFFFTSFVPLGDLLDAFGPYCCVLEDGSIVMKSPFTTQPYMYDTSLSLTKHVYPKDGGPAPQYTKFLTTAESIDRNEWTETAGLWRKNCPDDTWTSSAVDALCNQKTYCPIVLPKKSSVPRTYVKATSVPRTNVKDTYITTYVKPGGYSGSCRSGDDDWGIVPFCTAKNCQPGYDHVAGVCWKACDSNTQINVGALCRDKCATDYDDVAGICWKKCGGNQWDIGALCRDKCSGDKPHEEAGVCWSKCGDNEEDMGALCREKCKPGFQDLGCCWGNTQTFAREMKIPTATRVNIPGYLPPADINKFMTDNNMSYCDFSSTTMLDRMAQFYYKYSVMNPEKLEDGRISYEYIFMFFGVIASSELSCDVACSIKTVMFDPITGGNYEESFGTSYPEEPGNTTSYRRFYFLKLQNDPTGVFTVTGCTHVDYTAPDAHVYSGDVGIDPPISVPKIRNVIDKTVRPGQSFDSKAFSTALAGTATSVIISQAGALAGSRIGGVAGLATDVAGDLIGGFAGAAVSTSMTRALGTAVSYGEYLENKVVGNQKDGFYVSTNNDSYEINFGPIYEIRARDKSGYVPDITFCNGIKISELQCSHEFIVRDTIDEYHKQNPLKRLKTLYEVEPRGDDGCYFKWSSVSYDPTTNTEGTMASVEEVVHTFSIKDKSTCVFKPNFTFTNTTNYPIRTYKDPTTGEYKFPTKRVSFNATYNGRYIRIRPSLTATDGFLQISQIAVFDSMGVNISAGKAAYSTSLYSGIDGMAAPAGVITNGVMVVATGLVNTFQNSGNTTDYVDIDLGKNYFIDRIEYYGRRDSTNTTRNRGIRFQVLYTNEENAKPVVELLTSTTETIQQIDFTTKTLEPKTPTTPFRIPRSIPTNVNLNESCGVRCSDKYIIDTLVAGYNSDPAYTSSNQIIKVLRAATPTSSRCDYEVEMISTKGGVKTVGKEVISLKPILDTVTPNTGAVTARYIRVRPPTVNSSANNPYLYISQIEAFDTTGKNVALGKKVFSTSTFIDISNNIRSSDPFIITDGTVTPRSMPYIWKSGYVPGSTLSAEMLTAYQKEEYIDIDLGMSYPIQSVKYYGGSDSANNTVSIELLATRGTNDTYITKNILQTNDRNQTILFNKCTFKYSGVLSGAGSFIQENTPFLESVDTSGGVFTFQTIGKTIVNTINSIINPINTIDPLGKLNSNVSAAQQTAANTMNSIAAMQTLNGCPNVKCNDPDVLNAITNMYNISNLTITDGVAETRKMTRIIKSGISSGNTCDVLFTDLYEEYDDYLHEPTNKSSAIVAKRFTMTDTGNCAIQVLPGPDSIVDISANAIGITTPASVLPNVFNANICQVDCRDNGILNNLKTMLATQLQTTSVIPTFKSILQSFPSAPNKCEYMMKKDVTAKSPTRGTFSTNTDLETYIEASFTVNHKTCAFTLETVKEYDPDLVTSKLNRSTNVLESFINGILVNLPSLYMYDNTNPSTRVNETVQNL